MQSLNIKEFEKIADLRVLGDQEYAPGQIVHCVQNDAYYVFNGQDWLLTTKEVIQQMVQAVESASAINSNVVMNMYEINQQIISQLPDHTEEQLQKDIEIINEFDKTQKTNSYLLLCKEISYFTGFVREDSNKESLGEVVVDCIKYVGKIKDIDNSNPVYLDIWFTTKSGVTHCMHLFDFQYGIVGFGG